MPGVPQFRCTKLQWFQVPVFQCANPINPTSIQLEIRQVSTKTATLRYPDANPHPEPKSWLLKRCNASMIYLRVLTGKNLSHSRRSRLFSGTDPQPLQVNVLPTLLGPHDLQPSSPFSRIAFPVHWCLGRGRPPAQPGWFGCRESAGGEPCGPRNPQRYWYHHQFKSSCRRWQTSFFPLAPLTFCTFGFLQLTARRPRPSFRAPASWTRFPLRSPWSRGTYWESTAAQAGLRVKVEVRRWDLRPRTVEGRGQRRWSCGGDRGRASDSSSPPRRRRAEVSPV